MTKDDYHYPCTIQSISVLTNEHGQVYQQLMQSLQNCFCFLMYQLSRKSFKRFWSYLQPINNDEYDFDCDVLSSPTSDTIDKNGATYTPVLNYGSTGVGLVVNNEFGFDLIAALTRNGFDNNTTRGMFVTFGLRSRVYYFSKFKLIRVTLSTSDVSSTFAFCDT